MQTLDSALATAQSEQSRKPVCRIYSCENSPSIPFNGEFLDVDSRNERYPDAKVHSTGRLFVAFDVDVPSNANILRYGYTDADRTFYTYVDLDAAGECDHISFFEMADSYVGIVYSLAGYYTRYIKYKIITVTGVEISSGTIFTLGSSEYFSGPSCACLSDGTYILVYSRGQGENYYLAYKTSSNLVTWTDEAEVPISGGMTNRKANPSLLELADNTLWLLFDYLELTGPSGEELTNCYYVTSTNKLTTTSAPVALTTYDTFNETGAHPVATQKSTGDVYFVFNRIMASLHMDAQTTGWSGSTCSITDMFIDNTTQKLYVTASRGGLVNIAKVDLATWTIDKSWNTTSVPAFSSFFTEGTSIVQYAAHGEGIYVPIGGAGVVSVLNTQTDQITTYAFYDYASYGIAKNLEWTECSGFWLKPNMNIARLWVDSTNNRLYVCLTATYVYNVRMQIGWIDLTAPGPNYTFNTIITEVRTLGEAIVRKFEGSGSWWQIVPEDDLLIVSLGNNNGFFGAEGNLRVYSLSTGGLWKNYTTTTNPSFPKWGLTQGVYNNGVVGGVFHYESLYGQQDYRGFCLVDLASDVVTYSRPSWASVDDYTLSNPTLAEDGEYLMDAGQYGITLFDGVAWTLYNNSTVPGLTPDGSDYFIRPLVYNPTTDMIIAGAGVYRTTNWHGFIMFSREGYIKQSNYRIGTYGVDWTWTDIAPLVIGFNDYDSAVCVDPVDDCLYAFWINKTGSEYSIKWDKEMPVFDLTPYLVRGTPIERSSSIDPEEGNWDAELTFSVSHGHLFDVSNSKSMLRQYLAKGRRIQQQFGEEIGGVNIWEPAHLFTVSNDGEMEYEFGKYPIMNVSCETLRRRWSQIHIIASEYYSAVAEVIIADLIATYDTSVIPANIQLGTWGGTAVTFQAVDISLADAVNQLSVHCGYCIRDGAAGIIEAVPISNSASVDRAYSDNTKVINSKPQNDNSSFVNRWTVECEENTFIELLMAEELAAEFNASHRWNTGAKTYRVNYTQGSKIFRNPRMEVVLSVTSIGFELDGGCSETLYDNSHDQVDQTLWDTFCEIRVDSPDLTNALWAMILLIPITAKIGDMVVAWGGGWTRPVGTFITYLELVIVSMILGATGNFHYKVYGQPVVKVRRTVSSTVNDEISQSKMNQIIPEPVFQDSLCGSAAECLVVADFRKMVAMGERSRWGGEKVADLHNEEGDTISVIHYFSQEAVTVFITDLATSYMMPDLDSDNGYFKQEFEGWRR